MTTDVTSTKKLKPCRRSVARTSRQPSEWDVAAGLTATDKEFSPELLLAVAMCLLDGLSAQMFSPDAIKLGFMRAKSLGVAAGLDEQELVDALLHLHERMEARRQRNPMASMF